MKSTKSSESLKHNVVFFHLIGTASLRICWQTSSPSCRNETSESWGHAWKPIEFTPYGA
ncbi:unnamed protein product [Periconia digitata]|uniref:Uncharacterized protein n=1 Tax=Periconia digitata TaxID=1303443 RepID=A0A9W4XI26_9PLEO|nr:unnamed protein product [Periconia digitata]